MAEGDNSRERRIPLTKGMFTVVDEADYEWLSQFKWRVNPGGGGKIKNYYAITGSVHTKRFCMHRMIMGMPRTAEDGLVVDHINRDSLDNRRANLRVATIGQNNANRRRARGPQHYKGVSFSTKEGRWRANLILGSFLSKEEAARAYDKWARQLHGEFFVPNFPDSVP